jgi:large subunit ribosomal protein L29
MNEIRELASEGRVKKVEELRAELLNLMGMVKTGGSVENPSRVKEIRRTIARILTVENEERRKIPKDGAKA